MPNCPKCKKAYRKCQTCKRYKKHKRCKQRGGQGIAHGRTCFPADINPCAEGLQCRDNMCLEHGEAAPRRRQLELEYDDNHENSQNNEQMYLPGIDEIMKRLNKGK